MYWRTDLFGFGQFAQRIGGWIIDPIRCIGPGIGLVALDRMLSEMQRGAPE